MYVVTDPLYVLLTLLVFTKMFYMFCQKKVGRFIFYYYSRTAHHSGSIVRYRFSKLNQF